VLERRLAHALIIQAARQVAARLELVADQSGAAALLLAAGPAGLKHPAATLFPPFLPPFLRASIGGNQPEHRRGESSRREPESSASPSVESETVYDCLPVVIAAWSGGWFLAGDHGYAGSHLPPLQRLSSEPAEQQSVSSTQGPPMTEQQTVSTPSVGMAHERWLQQRLFSGEQELPNPRQQ
jgi:hypothetical protein